MKYTHFLRPLAWLLLAIALSGHKHGNHGSRIKTLTPNQLTVCAFPEFPPVVNVNGQGKWEGWDIDFMNDFAASLDLEVDFVTIDTFSGIWQLPGVDRCDIAAAGITRTNARMEESPGTVWSETYFSTLRSLLVHRDTPEIRNVGDLLGGTVIVTGNTTADLDLRRRLEGADLSDSVEVINSITEAESVQRVRDREVLGFAIGTVTAFYLSEGDEELKTTWCHPLLEDDGREGVDEFSFVVRERSTGLVKALNKYIDRTEYGLGDTVGCPEG